MAPDDEPGQASEAGAYLFIGAVALVFGSLLLMGVGVVVRDLSDVVGTPLPYVHDDPDRVEWDGLAELVAYGLGGALVVFASYLLARRVLPETVRGHIGRVIGVTTLLAFPAGAVLVAVGNWDPRAASSPSGAATPRTA